MKTSLLLALLLLPQEEDWRAEGMQGAVAAGGAGSVAAGLETLKAGGDAQDQVTLQLLLNHIDFGLEPATSVTAPRFLTGHFTGSFLQSPPRLGSLVLQDELESLAAGLRKRGHKVSPGSAPLWHPVAISIGPDGRLRAAGDPKARRHAAAY